MATTSSETLVLPQFWVGSCIPLLQSSSSSLWWLIMPGRAREFGPTGRGA
jgi:hypothetical protein